MGCFQGSIQSLSRSYYSKIIPPENSGEYFGIYDIFAKGASFLGSAVMLASHAETVWTGLFLLLVYSVGLGLPFVLSAVLLDRLRGTFSWIKSHYRLINLVCGVFLILVGVAMALGWFHSLIRSIL